MARKIKSATDQRRFTIVYNDFMDSQLLNKHEKLIYIAIKRFADNETFKAFPSIKKLQDVTGISGKSIKESIKHMEQLGVLKKENRQDPKRGHISNLYTLYDYAEMWQDSSEEGNTSAADDIKAEKTISQLISSGYTNEIVTQLAKLGCIDDIISQLTELKNDADNKEPENNNESTESTELTENNIKSIEENIERRKEKEPENLHTDQSSKGSGSKSNKENNQFVNNHNTSDCKESQASERYSLDEIKEYYDYNALVEQEPDEQDMIDSVFSILYTVLNTGETMLRVNRHDIPAMAVVSKLRKLTHQELLYCIEKYNAQTDKIDNPISYMLTLLFNAKEQMCLDIKNQVNSDYADIMGQDGQTEYTTYDDFTIRKKKE